MESERLSTMMRADKAEVAALAAHNELMDVTKRSVAGWLSDKNSALQNQPCLMPGRQASVFVSQCGSSGACASQCCSCSCRARRTNLNASVAAAAVSMCGSGNISTFVLPQ